MTVRSFVGPAGSGKTTRLMAALEARLNERALEEGERILAITRMHGARHRLEERLGHGSAHGLFDCMTMDRLAWMLVSRWRERLGERGERLPTELDFDETCRVAAALLGEPAVVRWIARRYPLVVVDEFQDCRDGRLGIVQGLSAACEVLLAADEFQDLSGDAGTPAVSWLRSAGDLVDLNQIHRTNDQELLAAATALRTGQSLKVGWGSGFSLVEAQNANVAASHVSRTIHWSGGGSLVVLSPTGPTKSAFVRAVLARVGEKPFEEKRQKRKKDESGQKEKPKAFGPYQVPWERSAEACDAAMREALRLPDGDDDLVLTPTIPTTERVPGLHEFEQWVEHCRRVKGRTSFTVAELREAVGRAVQHHRAHARPSRRIRAMTVQQAKNQEFDVVVILWPFEIQGDADRLRRLLYNAVTRARRKVVVVLQDFKSERVKKPPFA